MIWFEHHYWDLLKYAEADANKNLPYKEQIIQYIHSLWIISGSPPQDPQSYYCFNEMVPSASWFSNLLLPWLHPGSGKQNMKNWIDIQLYAWIVMLLQIIYSPCSLWACKIVHKQGEMVYQGHKFLLQELPTAKHIQVMVRKLQENRRQNKTINYC